MMDELLDPHGRLLEFFIWFDPQKMPLPGYVAVFAAAAKERVPA
jgi:hypothetical protein